MNWNYLALDKSHYNKILFIQTDNINIQHIHLKKKEIYIYHICTYIIHMVEIKTGTSW